MGARLAKALAEWSGLLVYSCAGLVRRVAATSGRDPDPRHVAVLCDAFVRYASAQARGLAQAGAKVTLYYVDRLDEFAGNERERSRHLEQARDSGVTLVPLPRRTITKFPMHTVWLHRDLRRRRVSVAVVQAHIDPRYATLGLTMPVALLLHDPKTHSGDHSSTFPLPVRMLSRFSELTAARLIVHSRCLLAQIRPMLRRLPAGAVSHGAEMFATPDPVPSERRLLVFGRLYAYKGVDTALQAFELLREQLGGMALTVAGRGPLAALAETRPGVELRDEYIPDAEVDELLAGARLVLLPYKDATQSGVGLQAVARGVPCVVTSTGALPELVEGASSALVVPPDDPAALAEAIAASIDHDLALRQAIFDHAAKTFAWPVVGRRLRAELSLLRVAGSRRGEA